MFLRDIVDCDAIVAGDNSLLRELFNPLEDDMDVRYSLAVAIVEPGGTTYLHRLKNSEVYFILDGTGEMRIGDETEEVHAGHAVYIPPNAEQQITNTGDDDLMFVCIVDPAWKKEDEEVLETNGEPAVELEFTADDVIDDDDIFDDEDFDIEDIEEDGESHKNGG
jgi:mannose-6-phosphate isomerase-like protein (cupin superfamily)